MKPAPFEYVRPETVEGTVEALASPEAKVLAGGQSLVPIMSMRLASPSTIVDINRVSGLGGIQVTDDGVRIGALVRHRALELDDRAYDANPLLRRAVSQVAHPTIRNRGTTVGSLVHADPAAEMPAVLLLCDGSVEVVGTGGTRTVEAADFFLGPLESAVGAGELAVSATFLRPPAGSGSAWMELSRRHGDYALVGVGALVATNDRGQAMSARVVLIGVGPTPVLVELDSALPDRRADTAAWSDAVDLIVAAIDPEADIHATVEYRNQLARVLGARALRAAGCDAATRVAA